MDKLMRAKAEQRRLKKRVHKHKKAASEARWEPNQAYVALGNLHSQMEQVDQQRATTEEARADDQARLAGLREQLEAARAEAFTATHQRNLTNNRATSTEAERVRTRAVSAMQDRVERDLCQQLA
jgi:chromosome segregation ATPase